MAKFYSALIALTLLIAAVSQAQKIGINQNDPLTTLHINSADSAVLLLANTQPFTDDTKASLYFAIGPYYTGAIKTHVQQSGSRMSFFTGANTNGNSLAERFTIANNGNIGIGNNTPTAPLTFPAAIGKKITLYPGVNGDVGFGVVGNLLQIYSDYLGADIAFGYGSSSAFTENMRIRGNGNVGIGTSNPLATLQVKRGTGINGTAAFEGTTNVSHFNYSTSEETYIRGGKADSKVFINDLPSGDVSIAAGGGSVGIGVGAPTAKLDIAGNVKIVDGSQAANKVLTSDANGFASWKVVPEPAGVMFSAAQAAGFSLTSNNTTQIPFSSENYDTGNGFASGTFTAPVTGVYHFDADIPTSPNISSGGTASIEMRVNNVAVRSFAANFTSNSPIPSMVISCDLKLFQGNTVNVYAYQFNTGGSSALLGGGNNVANPHFTGHRVF